MKILILGILGNIGKRHAENAISLGHEVIGVDFLHGKESSLKIYDSISAVEDIFDVAMVCSPTELHIEHALQLIHYHDFKMLFVEKPISHNMENIDFLVKECEAYNIKLFVGCNYRFDNGIQLINLLLNNNTIGDIYSVEMRYGYDLKKWHPESDYTKSYSAGITGGALFEDIHSIDLMMHLFGEFESYDGNIYKSNHLPIQNEASFEGVFTTKKGIPIHVHSDLLNPYRTRTLEIFGINGEIKYDFFDAQVYLKTLEHEETRIFKVCDDLNYMYIKQFEYIIGCVQHDIQPKHSGIRALEIVLDIKNKIKIDVKIHRF